jgi:cation:H+ antiporter
MILVYILFVLGFPALLVGAHLLVRGAGSVALKLGVSELAVGLTVVAFGTSAPELFIAVMSAVRGYEDLAVASVVGSNTANLLLILGIAAVIRPLTMHRTLRWREIPFVLLSVLVLAAVANDQVLGGGGSPVLARGDGLVLLGYFAIYMYYVFSVARKRDEAVVGSVDATALPFAILMILSGGAGLAFGGQWIVTGAREIARSAGMSEALVGLTIISIGTCLPELATTAVAAKRGNSDLAVGTVVGSNVLNVLWILGVAATVKPVDFNVALNVDIWILVAATLVFFLFTFTGGRHRIDRLEGIALLVFYGVYLTFLILRG